MSPLPAEVFCATHALDVAAGYPDAIGAESGALTARSCMRMVTGAFASCGMGPDVTVQHVGDEPCRAEYAVQSSEPA